VRCLQRKASNYAPGLNGHQDKRENKLLRFCSLTRSQPNERKTDTLDFGIRLLTTSSSSGNEQQRQRAAVTTSTVNTNGSLGHTIATYTSHRTTGQFYSLGWLTFSQAIPAVGNVMPSLNGACMPHHADTVIHHSTRRMVLRTVTGQP